MNKRHLVIGCGEVGSALASVLNCDTHDPLKGVVAVGRSYDVLHVCFPFSDLYFREAVNSYRDQFKTSLCVVHSTVPVGTCDNMGVIHSPIRGVHPNLAEGIKTFVKFFGGERAQEAADLFTEIGIQCQVTEKAATTEALKLWDTLQYGINILLEKEIHQWCEQFGIDFDIVYTKANQTYNEGYDKLGKPHFKKYVLRHSDGPIGGHCVVPNAKLLMSYSAVSLIASNESLERGESL